jgi:thiamine transporter
LKLKIRPVAEIAMMVALSIVFGYMRFFTFSHVGSVTLSSVPIVLIAILRGPVSGCLTGAIVGVLKFFLKGFAYHPVAFFLDFPLAYALLGVAGFFKKRPKFAILVGHFLRFLAHFLSGAIFFKAYAPANLNPWRYSAIFNFAQLFPEFLICFFLICLIIRKFTPKTNH